MKKFVAGFLTCAVLSLSITVFANINATKANFKILLNGNEFVSENPPLVVDGRTYLPLRSIGEALGVPINWNGEKRQVEITTQKETQSDENKTYKIGDSFISKNIKYTIHGVREIPATEYFAPEKGKIWYAIEITVENQSSEKYYSSEYNIKLSDKDSYSYNSTITFTETKGSLNGDILPNKKLRGEVVFEISKDLKGLELQISPQIINSDIFVIKLDR